MSKIKYAGIGARDTPKEILDEMELFAQGAAELGWILRSGGAKGADTAFEFGALNADGDHEIYTPQDARNHPYRDHWMEVASAFHPKWEKCTPWARVLHARNTPIILGQDTQDPVNFVVCWTKDGTVRGGTGQGMRIAAAHDIPIYNMYYPMHRAHLKQMIKEGKFYEMFNE